MKKLMFRTLNLAIILVLVSCASSKNAHLVNQAARESPSETELVLTTSKPQPSPSGSKTPMTAAEGQPQVTGEFPRIEAGYLIGPGDVLSIEVWKHPDVSRDVVVNDDGEIRLPPIKSIRVMGMTVPQLEEKLTETLSKYLIDPAVFITIKEYNSQRVIALGETATGIYTLKRRTTLVEFLSQIGGLKENADILHIRLIKKDGKIYTYDFNELVKDPQKSEDALVSGGDTLYVPPLEMNKVYVFGYVGTPKAIPIKGKMTLLDAITEAGGATPNAATKSIIVVRGEPGAAKGIRINLDQILKNADLSQNIELVPGDIVYVPKTFLVDLETFIRIVGTPLYWFIWFR